MFDDNSESDCGPGFGCMSSESIRIKNSTKRLLHINDIICDVRVVCLTVDIFVLQRTYVISLLDINRDAELLPIVQDRK